MHDTGPVFTDAERLDFIQKYGLDYNGQCADSAWIDGITVVEEPKAGEKPEPFNLRRAIDFAMHQHKKRYPDHA